MKGHEKWPDIKGTPLSLWPQEWSFQFDKDHTNAQHNSSCPWASQCSSDSFVSVRPATFAVPAKEVGETTQNPIWQVNATLQYWSHVQVFNIGVKTERAREAVWSASDFYFSSAEGSLMFFISNNYRFEGSVTGLILYLSVLNTVTFVLEVKLEWSEPFPEVGWKDMSVLGDGLTPKKLFSFKVLVEDE